MEMDFRYFHPIRMGYFERFGKLLFVDAEFGYFCAGILQHIVTIPPYTHGRVDAYSDV